LRKREGVLKRSPTSHVRQRAQGGKEGRLRFLEGGSSLTKKKKTRRSITSWGDAPLEKKSGEDTSGKKIFFFLQRGGREKRSRMFAAMTLKKRDILCVKGREKNPLGEGEILRALSSPARAEKGGGDVRLRAGLDRTFR